MIALQAMLVAMMTLLVTSGGADVQAPSTDDAAGPAPTVTPIEPPDAVAPVQPVGRFVPFQPDPPHEMRPDWSPLVQPIAEPFFVLMTNPINDGEIVEGDNLRLTWRTGGPVASVRMYYEYENCRLGGRTNGSVGKVIADTMLRNTGEYIWKVPWMDTHKLRLRIAAYDDTGGKIDAREMGLQYRPKELVGLPPTAIGIIKSRQRLYYFQDGKIKRMHIVSTAASGYWTPLMEPGSHDPRRGSMGQVYSKSGNAWSRRYECWMPYWMAITSSGSHGIHATSSGFYRRLGRPASHGCVRQHRADARKLFGMVSVGTPVYVK